MSSQDETDLIRSASCGDRVALTQLLVRHHDSLRLHVQRQLAAVPNGTASPEDILQQTVVRAAQAVARFEQRESGSFLAWLKTIAANLIKDARKRRVRERRALRVSPDMPASGASAAMIVEGLAADSTPPVRKVQLRESVHRLRAAVAQLPDEQREVIERYYLLNESLDDIADVTGRTKGAVRGICYRARQRLRALMGGSSLYFSG